MRFHRSSAAPIVWQRVALGRVERAVEAVVYLRAAGTSPGPFRAQVPHYAAMASSARYARRAVIVVGFSVAPRRARRSVPGAVPTAAATAISPRRARVSASATRASVGSGERIRATITARSSPRLLLGEECPPLELVPATRGEAKKRQRLFVDGARGPRITHVCRAFPFRSAPHARAMNSVDVTPARRSDAPHDSGSHCNRRCAVTPLALRGSERHWRGDCGR